MFNIVDEDKYVRKSRFMNMCPFKEYDNTHLYPCHRFSSKNVLYNLWQIDWVSNSNNGTGRQGTSFDLACACAFAASRRMYSNANYLEPHFWSLRAHQMYFKPLLHRILDLLSISTSSIAKAPAYLSYISMTSKLSTYLEGDKKARWCQDAHDTRKERCKIRFLFISSTDPSV